MVLLVVVTTTMVVVVMIVTATVVVVLVIVGRLRRRFHVGRRHRTHGRLFALSQFAFHVEIEVDLLHDEAGDLRVSLQPLTCGVQEIRRVRAIWLRIPDGGVGSLAITFSRLDFPVPEFERVFLASVKSQMVVVHEDQRYVLLHRLHVSGAFVRAILLILAEARTH